MSDTPELLSGRYEVGKVIGRGGMAEVHLGRDLRLGRTVAIKVLRADLARDPAFQARFRREAQSAASLNHPAVVAVYDTGEDSVDGIAVPFIVMEYVEGSTLRDLLSSGKRLVPERAMEVTAAVLTALEYSHKQGIVHRDIKPGNVMLTKDRQVKVMDFGIARALADTGAMTQTAAVMGTAQYLSPEQARGEQVDARSDLYSTGCLLYELLTGRPPFTGDSPVSVAYQHVREEPQPPSSVDPEVSSAADAVVMRALTKDRDQRYQTAAEFRADLERAISGQVPVGSTAPRRAAFAGSPRSPEPVTQRIGTTPGLLAAPTGPQYPGRGTEEPAQRGASFWVTLVLAVLALFTLVAVASYFLLGGGNDDGNGQAAEQITVPSLVGSDFIDASRTLQRLGLVAERNEVTNAAPDGQVLSQDPVANGTVDAGGTVRLTVSSGPGTVTVPDLVGLDRTAAENRLEELGLKAEVDEIDSSRSEDEVVSTSPEDGSTRTPGDTITLKVASGRNTVPDLTGQTGEAADQQLRERGFTVRVVTAPSPNADSEGTVIDQDPSGPVRRAVGSTVTITVGEAAVETPSPTPSATETGTGAPTSDPTATSTTPLVPVP